MKKLIVILAIATTSFASAQAQTSFGIKAGLNGYSLTGDDTDGINFKTKFGGNGGFFANIPLSTQFSLQPEAVFSMEGAKISEGGQTGTFALNYVNVPVLVQFNTTSGFFVEAGPQIGFLTSAKAKADGEEEDLKDGLKSTAFSIALGAGYKLTENVRVNGRYNLGVSNIVDESGSDLKTSGFQIGLSYSFGSSKSN